MTTKRSQEFSINFSVEDSRIISEKRQYYTFIFVKVFYASWDQSNLHCGKVYLFFLFLLKTSVWDYNYSVIKWNKMERVLNERAKLM